MRDELSAELEKYKLSLPILDELSTWLKGNGKLQQQRIGWHCHLTECTAAAAKVLLDNGAQLFLSECNPETTSTAAVEYMRDLGARVFLGSDSCSKVLSNDPKILADTGLVLIRAYLASGSSCALAASEITTSGITVLHQMMKADPLLSISVININAGQLKSNIENFHGVADGVIDALFRLTGRLWSGRPVAVAGYGPVGAGTASYLRRQGAEVTIVESDPVKQLIAHYDGYRIADLKSALNHSQLVVTATGAESLIGKNEWQQASDGLLVVNVGHWSSELDLKALKSISNTVTPKGPYLDEYALSDGRRITVATHGSPANVVLLSGSPEPTLIHLTTEILSMNYLIELHHKGVKLPIGETKLPIEIEQQASILALRALKLMSGAG